MPVDKKEKFGNPDNFVVHNLDSSLSKEEKKAILKEKVKNNIALIQTVCPEFEMSEEEIDEFLSDKRLENHERAKEYVENKKKASLEFSGGNVPLAIKRTWFFESGVDPTPEARIRREQDFNFINSQTPASIKRNKTVVIDRLNKLNKWDPKFTDKEKSFDERVSLALDDKELCEIGHDSSILVGAMESSIGMSAAPELMKEIRKTQSFGVDVGGEGNQMIEFAATDVFLTFPVDKMTPEQAMLFGGAVLSFKDTMGWDMETVQTFNRGASMISLSKDKYPAPSVHEFAIDEFNHVPIAQAQPNPENDLPTVSDTRESLSQMRNDLKKSNHWYNARSSSNEYKNLEKSLDRVLDLMKDIDGPFETYPDELKKAIGELAEASEKYNAHVGDKGKNKTQQERFDISKKVQALSGNISSNFSRFVDNHNTKDAKAFFKAVNAEQELNASSETQPAKMTAEEINQKKLQDKSNLAALKAEIDKAKKAQVADGDNASKDEAALNSEEASISEEVSKKSGTMEL